MPQRIAFLGLGLMGSGMARRLLSAGYAVTVHNRTRAKADSAIAAGATWAASPREAAATADAVISMVADDSASRSVWLGHEGALADIRGGTFVIESSTVTPDWVAELRAAAEAESCRVLDAPVSGSTPQAESGQLTFMVGGAADVFSAARPILETMGTRIVHVGGPGAGIRTKLLNNFLNGVQAASFAEALAAMVRSGVDPEKAMPIIVDGAPGSPFIKKLYERIKNGDETAYFYLKLMHKDLTYAQQEASHYDLPLRTAAAAQAVFESAIVHGDGDRDVSAIGRQFLAPETA